MNSMTPRMNPPRGSGMGPMGPGSYGPGMRGPPPNSSLGPGPGGGPGMPPMPMAGGRPQWQPNTSTVSLSASNYSSLRALYSVIHLAKTSVRFKKYFSLENT